MAGRPREEEDMYQHILLPTDGSPLSEAAARTAIALARGLGARITAFYAMSEFQALAHRAGLLNDTREQFERQALRDAEQALGFVRRLADQEGVACTTEQLTSDHPHQVIVQTAERLGCDLIVMASHGRRGLAGLLIGSETQKVLAHCQISVLVHR